MERELKMKEGHFPNQNVFKNEILYKKTSLLVKKYHFFISGTTFSSCNHPKSAVLQRERIFSMESILLALDKTYQKLNG